MLEMLKNRSLLRRAAIAVAGVALVMGMTGCDDNKGRITILENENRDLREKAAQSDAAARDAQSQLMAMQTKAAQTPAMTEGGGGGGGGKGGGRGGGRTSGGDQVIEIAGDVLFGSGSATLKPEAKSELNKIASQLNGKYAQYNIRVEGHTDSDPIKKSKWKTNEALSEARARAVADYLSSRGVSAGRLSSVGMGSSKPKGSKKESRRVDIVILGAG